MLRINISIWTHNQPVKHVQVVNSCILVKFRKLKWMSASKTALEFKFWENTEILTTNNEIYFIQLFFVKDKSDTHM